MKLQARNFVVRKPETIDITMFFKKFCIATRTSKKSLKALCFQGFFLFLESADPYLDSLCFCHTMDVLIHSVCAFTFHAVCGVSVHIKGKRRGLMSEIFLHSLDVIAGLQAVYGVSMTEIMILQPSNLRAG